jgi:hypothetical protein
MADSVDKVAMADSNDPRGKSNKLTRRDMIKGVIAAGAVCSTGYLVRSALSHTSAASPGSVERLIMLNVNGQQRAVDVMKQETLAQTLRVRLLHRADRRHSGVCLFGADPLHARQENPDH